MQKLKSLFGIVVIFALLLSSCAMMPLEQQEPLPENPSSNSQETSQNRDDSQKEPETDHSDSDEDPSHTPEQPPEQAPEQSGILGNNRQALDEAGLLWYIPNERMEQGIMQELLLTEQGLLLTGSAAGSDGNPVLRLTLLSLDDGAPIAETTVAGFEMPEVQICGESIVITDWLGGGIMVLNSNLEKTTFFEVPLETGAAYVSPDMNTIYCFDSENGILVLNAEGTQQTVLLEHAVGLYASKRCGDTVSFFYTDADSQLTVIGILDLNTGAITKLPFEGAFSNAEYSDGLWLANVMGGDGMYYLGRAERPMAFTPAGNHTIVSMLSNPNRLLSTSYSKSGQAILTLYDTDGDFLSSCTMPEQIAAVTGSPVWSPCDGGYYLAVIEGSGKDQLLFWDLSAPVSGESLQLSPAYSDAVLSGTALPQELYDRAAQISETYGITVKIGDLCNTEIQEFTAAYELDSGYVSAGLDTLEAVLSCYPDRFLEQLVYGSFATLEIHLTGALTKNDIPSGSSGFHNFVGVNAELEGKNVIAVNISQPGSVSQTMHHEIMHVIDSKLAFDASMRPDTLYSEAGWMALNPEGFAYAESYHNLPDSIWNDGYDRWFAEIYSRTYIREDRATIMEYAMAGSDWTFTAAPGRLEKLSYLCSCIRDAFDTEGWPEYTVWETTLYRCGGQMER